MAIRVVVNPGYRRRTVRTVGVGYVPSTRFRDLSDVTATDLDNNETVVYNESTDKFEVKTLPDVYGGEF